MKKQRVDLRLDFLLGLLPPLVAHRFVAQFVGLYLGAIDRHQFVDQDRQSQSVASRGAFEM